MISRPYTLGGSSDGDGEEDGEEELSNLIDILIDQVDLTEALTNEFIETLASHLHTIVREAKNTLNRGRHDQVIPLVNRISHMLIALEEVIAEDSLKSVPTCILDAFNEAWNPPQ